MSFHNNYIITGDNRFVSYFYGTMTRLEGSIPMIGVGGSGETRFGFQSAIQPRMLKSHISRIKDKSDKMDLLNGYKKSLCLLNEHREIIPLFKDDETPYLKEGRFFVSETYTTTEFLNDDGDEKVIIIKKNSKSIYVYDFGQNFDFSDPFYLDLMFGEKRVHLEQQPKYEKYKKALNFMKSPKTKKKAV